MATTVTMPQLGETVTEGTILRWAKKVGDQVAVDEILLEISTDKVDTEVPSPAAGVVTELLVGEGETVAVGTALAVIGGGEDGSQKAEDGSQEEEGGSRKSEGGGQEEEGGSRKSEGGSQEEEGGSRKTEDGSQEQDSRRQTPDASPEPVVAQEAPAPAAPEARVQTPAAPVASSPQASSGAGEGRGEVLSPVVRKLVREHGVDLDAVTGTGEGGRITRRDIEAHLATRPEDGAAASPTPPAPAAEAPPAAPPAPSPVTAPAARSTEAPAPMAPRAPVAASGTEEVPLDRLRIRIAENLVRAKQTAAHVWTSVEVDYERVERVRAANRDDWKKEEGFSLTYLPFIARATIDALKEYPVVNSSFFLEDKKAVLHRSVNLGIAIDLDQKGLVVATIRNADGLRLVGLARRIRELAEKARAGKLEPDDVTGSTFSITNPGPFGSFLSAPIINVPNTGLLSTETITKRPAVVTTDEGQDTIAIRHIGYLGFSWDHRAFDGSTAVLFLQRIKNNLENWDWNQELA